jgi:hypothetical protein
LGQILFGSAVIDYLPHRVFGYFFAEKSHRKKVVVRQLAPTRVIMPAQDDFQLDD